MVLKLQENEDNLMFRVEWVCFACCRKLKNRLALYAHLKHCWWYQNVYKNCLEEAPCYKRRSSKQLRYYYAHKPRILRERKERRDREKSSVVGNLRGVKRLPTSLRRR